MQSKIIKNNNNYYYIPLRSFFMTHLLFLFSHIPQSSYNHSWTHTRKPDHSPPLYHNVNIVYASIIAFIIVRKPCVIYKTVLHENNLMHQSPLAQCLMLYLLKKNYEEEMHNRIIADDHASFNTENPIIPDIK